MKKKYISLFVVCSLLLSLGISCQKDDDATPYVKYVRPTNAAQADSLLTRAAMGSTIAIIGHGLAGVCEVWFNDQRARLNPVYVTETSIIVTVPGSMPNEITDKVTLRTSKGKSYSFDFAVIIPAPRVVSIKNEWAADGMETIIYGDFFFPDENGNLLNVLFPGNLSATVIAREEQEIRVRVPAGALSGYITVESIYGTGRSQFIFRDSRGMFIDAEEPTSVWNTWGRSAFDTQGGTSGQYIRLNGQTSSWGWPADPITVLYFRPDGTPIVTDEYPENYALKFEMNVIAWTAPHLVMWFNTTTPNIDDPNAAQYFFYPVATDGWTTITIPLSSFTDNKPQHYNNASGNSPKINSVNELVNFYIFPFGPFDEGVPAPAPFDIWLDNFRIV